MKIFSIMVLLAVTGCLAEKGQIHKFELSETELSKSGTFNFDNSPSNNLFEISLSNAKIVSGKKLFLIFESENPDFVVTILDDSKGSSKASALMDLATFSGNSMMVMSDTFFNKKLDFFKKSGSLKLLVSNKSKLGSKDYKIRVEIGQIIELDFGRVYTTRVDFKITNLSFDLKYNGLSYPELQKLRFQLTSVRQHRDYSLSASLEHKNSGFQLNTIFQKTVGGILSLPNLPVCVTENCVYRLNITLNNIKVLNIETFLINKIEKLSIQHYEEYYDRVFQPNVTTFYELPYEDSMEEMDVTISLIPVTGTTGLYINAKTLPLDLENFDWKEKGPLAKRITIKWEELVQMRAEKSNLFLAVSTTKPGEYLIKVDAHDPGYRGRLNSGVIEAGFVGYNEISNYLYFFEVFETQEITFDIRLNIVSGDANLYLKQCANFANCKIDELEIAKSDVFKIENNQNSKLISHTFTCEHKGTATASSCEFVIGVKGKENHGTHYEVSLQEANFHRLMIPGHSVPINLNADQTVYMKFSYPAKNKDSSLYLSIEALWGSFDVFLSKSDVYPSDRENNHKESFVSTKLGLYNSLRTIKIDPSKLGDYNLQGLYYVTVKALTSCALNIKFYDKSSEEISVHTLVAGSQVRGEITHKNEVVYYTIKAALETQRASTVSVNLTPLKGQYVMFANRNGKLPTKDNKELSSLNHHLELSYQTYDNKQDEYIIGVQLNGDYEIKDNSFQYLISIIYSNKPLKLNPGVLSTHIITEANYFLIEVTDEMKNLIILKSIVDGYNIGMCAKFTFNESEVSNDSCAYSADDKAVAIYIDEAGLKSKCKDVSAQSQVSKCFIQVSVTGNKNQKFSIGFTYNDYPFQLVKNQIVTGPTVINGSASLNFIYHAEPEKPIRLYFNAKGREMRVYTKLARGDHFDDHNSLNFPNSESHDDGHQERHGSITNVFYDETTVSSFGTSPEVLVSIRASNSNGEGALFDFQHAFVLQTSLDAHEILRTQTFEALVKEEEWNYYTFYNNGNSDTLRIYVTSAVTTRLEVLLSRGVQSRPPFSNKAIVSKIGIGSVDLDLKPKDLKLESHSEGVSLKGHFTVAVKSSNSCNLSIFWNNKEDLNYIELTPNEPSTMMLDRSKSFYFAFYARDAEATSDRGIVSLYVKANVQANVYLLKTGGELAAPSSSSYNWKGSLGPMGGVTLLQVKPSDPEYCVDCLYIGLIETSEDGQISLLANILHDKVPALLTPGFTIPDALPSHERLFYRIHNIDSGPINLSISMLSGFITVYISASDDVSESNFVESFPLESSLDIHKFITIVPSRYNVDGPHNFYLLITNEKPDTATFTLAVDKNGLKSPVEPGLTKFLHLAPNESTDFVYTPRESENLFEVRLELRQVLDPKLIDLALQSLPTFIGVYHINEKNDRYILKYRKKSVSGNKLYISFDITENTRGTFAIHLYNPLGAAVALAVDLLNGGYKLVNLNEFTVDQVRRDDPVIYEAFGQKSKYLFVDLKVCHGDVGLEFFQSDYENVTKNNTSEFKQIKDSNSMVHYLSLEHERVFLRVTNKKEELSIYEISLFNERDLDNNPYSEVAQGDGGKVEIETDNNVIHFHPISLRSTYSKNFYHSVNYTVFLSDNFKTMRYVKNCGGYMLNHAFDNAHVLSFSKVVQFGSIEDVDKVKEKMTIKVEGLRPNTKYYGVLVAKIDLFPLEGGYVAPVRSGKTFYDEFVFITPKFNVPFNLVIASMVIVAFFVFLTCIIKTYVFGRVNQMKMFERLSDLSQFDDGVLGMNIISILEKEYYKDIDTPDETTEEETHDEGKENGDIEAGPQEEYEMTDNSSRTKPLDG